MNKHLSGLLRRTLRSSSRYSNRRRFTATLAAAVASVTLLVMIIPAVATTGIADGDVQMETVHNVPAEETASAETEIVSGAETAAGAETVAMAEIIPDAEPAAEAEPADGMDASAVVESAEELEVSDAVTNVSAEAAVTTNVSAEIVTEADNPASVVRESGLVQITEEAVPLAESPLSETPVQAEESGEAPGEKSAGIETTINENADGNSFARVTEVTGADTENGVTALVRLAPEAALEEGASLHVRFVSPDETKNDENCLPVRALLDGAHEAIAGEEGVEAGRVEIRRSYYVTLSLTDRNGNEVTLNGQEAEIELTLRTSLALQDNERTAVLLCAESAESWQARSHGENETAEQEWIDDAAVTENTDHRETTVTLRADRLNNIGLAVYCVLQESEDAQAEGTTVEEEDLKMDDSAVSEAAESENTSAGEENDSADAESKAAAGEQDAADSTEEASGAGETATGEKTGDAESGDGSDEALMNENTEAPMEGESSEELTAAEDADEETSAAEDGESAGSAAETTLTEDEQKKAAADEEAEAEGYTGGVLTAEVEGCIIRMEYTPAARIPEDATLEVRRIETRTREYNKLVGQYNNEHPDAQVSLESSVAVVRAVQNTAKAVGDYFSSLFGRESGESDNSLQVVELFDITIRDPEGLEIEPAAEVAVEICLDTLDEAVEDSVSVMHFDDALTDMGASVDGRMVSFATEGFSVYGVVYRIDFELEDGDEENGEHDIYSLSGGEVVSLREVLVALGMTDEESVEDYIRKEIESVKFSRDELVRIEPVEDGSDWRITPVGLFDTEEFLVLSMTDGRRLYIRIAVSGVSEVSTDNVVISAADGRILPEDAEGSFAVLVGAEADRVMEDAGVVSAADTPVTSTSDSMLMSESVSEDTAAKELVPETVTESAGNVRDSREQRESQVFDISLENVDTEVYEEGFRVELTLPESVAGRDFELIHVHDGVAEPLDVELIQEEIDGICFTTGVSFTTGDFSAFVLSYTVDFHYEVNGRMFEFSIPGGGFVSLTSLVETLGMVDDEVFAGMDAQEAAKAFVADVAGVEFSSPELVSVSRIAADTTVGAIKDALGLECVYSSELTSEQIAEVNARTVEAGDWALISVRPFMTEETLNITLTNGDKVIIRTTDGQIRKTVISAGGEAFEITVTYTEEAEIPDGAELRTYEILHENSQYPEYYQRTLAALQGLDELDFTVIEEPQDCYARFFDIEIVHGTDIIEPEAEVSVNIKLSGTPQNESLSVIHFEDQGAVLLNAEAQRGFAENRTESMDVVELCFTTGSFSTYGVFAVPNNSHPDASDLDGRSFTISQWRNTNGWQRYYMTANQKTTQSPAIPYLEHSVNASDAVTWRFEKDGEGKYYIYTISNEQKNYIRFATHGNVNGQGQGNLTLVGDKAEASAFDIERRQIGNDYYYFVSLPFEYQGSAGIFYLKDMNYGFVCSTSGNYTEESGLVLAFNDQVINQNSGAHYALVTKYNDKYYIVLNDGVLKEVNYDPVSNRVSTDNPVTWEYVANVNNSGGFNLRLPVDGLDFDQQQLAYAFTYHLIDPIEEAGYASADQSYNHSNLQAGPVPVGTQLYFDGRKIYANDNGNRLYLGIEEQDDGTYKLVGRKTAEGASDILFTFIDNVPSGNQSPHGEHVVNHIDISVQGSTTVKVPMAYGDYYDEHGELIYTATPGDHMLTHEETVEITQNDIKNAKIIATKYEKTKEGDYYTGNTDTKVEVSDAYYVTGYSGNAEFGDSTQQVRIEGTFKVADIDPDGYYSTGSSWVKGDTINDNSNPQIRLDNIIYYTVEVTKMVTLPLTFNGQQLYDHNGTPLKTTVPVKH